MAGFTRNITNAVLGVATSATECAFGIAPELTPQGHDTYSECIYKIMVKQTYTKEDLMNEVSELISSKKMNPEAAALFVDVSYNMAREMGVFL